MLRYSAHRLALLVPTLIGASVVTFLLVRLLPGDAVDILIGIEVKATPAVAQQIREVLGLDRPLPEQYGRWAWAVLHGDLGISISNGAPVVQELLRRVPVTLELVVLSMVITVVVGIPVGVVGALRRNRWPDEVGRLFSLLGLSLPSFWVGTLLVLLFSVWLRWLPVVGFVPLQDDLTRNLKSMMLPAATLGLALVGAMARMTRSSMLDVLHQDYVKIARAKGLHERNVVIQHALRNALIPVLTLLGVQMGVLLGGAIIVEDVFSLPGIGTLMINAVNQRDYPVIQGIVLFVTLSVILLNLVVDLGYGVLDPRIRYGK